LKLRGFQSSADVFTVEGKLVYSTYSDQLFDVDAANPYAPAIEIWPSTMELEKQNELTNELQRLMALLNVKSGIYNVECRVCENGKAYIMEVSPRGGGNRIAELQEMATEQNLIKNEVLKALNMTMDAITMPSYKGVWCNYILHSLREGVLESVEINDSFKRKHVRGIGITKNRGDRIDVFNGANQSLGTLFLQFDTREELNKALSKRDEWLRINLR
jgi:biotin carboxylase